MSRRAAGSRAWKRRQGVQGRRRRHAAEGARQPAAAQGYGCQVVRRARAWGGRGWRRPLSRRPEGARAKRRPAGQADQEGPQRPSWPCRVCGAKARCGLAPPSEQRPHPPPKKDNRPSHVNTRAHATAGGRFARPGAGPQSACAGARRGAGAARRGMLRPGTFRKCTGCHFEVPGPRLPQGAPGCWAGCAPPRPKGGGGGALPSARRPRRGGGAVGTGVLRKGPGGRCGRGQGAPGGSGIR
ncbi:MAG: hypothetical protein J3K34DRAFT_223932 [Monoraphidium minutum]|nr:MAG: hypothetical protein J3K34DRAFT_223932 [Monoraphidium minutum]